MTEPPGVRSLLGPNPFADDDPRHDHFERVASLAAEAEARLQADVLRLAEKGPPEDLPVLTLDFMSGRFDIAARSLVVGLGRGHGPFEALRDELERMAERTLSWLDNHHLPRWINKRELRAQLRVRLMQRSAHWMAEAIRLVRELHTPREDKPGATESARPDGETTGAVTPDPPAPEAPDALVLEPPTDPDPAAVPAAVAGDTSQAEADVRNGEHAPGQATSSEGDREGFTPFPARAAWLQERLAERSWGVYDLEKNGGPMVTTTRKILSGKPVRPLTLEKLATALSEKGKRVLLRDIPRS